MVPATFEESAWNTKGMRAFLGEESGICRIEQTTGNGRKKAGMTAYLIVRAEVAEADRSDFDRWYGMEHLSEAKVLFRAKSACRGWSDVGSRCSHRDL